MKKYILFSLLFFCFFLSSLVAMKKDSHKVYLERYPKLHATYNQCSNEGELFLKSVAVIAKKIKTNCPDFYKNGVQIFTIGCRNGEISKAAIEIFKQQGIQNISFRGIDRFEVHKKQTEEKIKDGVVIHDDFETYQLTKQDKKYANVVLVLQACHFVKKMEFFVQKIHHITQQDAIVVFAHSDDSQMNWAIKKVANQFKSKYMAKDVCQQIEKSLQFCKAVVNKTSEKPILNIPKILPEIAKLEKVQYEDYENEYEEHSESFHIVKNLIELGLDTPLESFGSWSKNWILLPAFKKNFKPENQLPLTTHIVVFASASDELKKIIE